MLAGVVFTGFLASVFYLMLEFNVIMRYGLATVPNMTIISHIASLRKSSKT
jgi:hypothetical protein